MPVQARKNKEGKEIHFVKNPGRSGPGYPHPLIGPSCGFQMTIGQRSESEGESMTVMKAEAPCRVDRTL